MARRWKKNPYKGRTKGIYSRPTREMLDLIDRLTLATGSHEDPTQGVCVMEALGYITRQSHSDHPICTSQVITEQMIGLNDSWGDEDRQALKEVIPELIGTRPTRLMPVDREILDKQTGQLRPFSYLVEEPDSTPEYLDAEEKRRRLLDGISYKEKDEAIRLLKEACAIDAGVERVEPDDSPVIVHEHTEAITSIAFEEVPLDPAGIALDKEEVQS